MPVRMSEDAASTNQYRQLNPVAVRATIDRLAERIRARFPHRNLPLIAAELSRTIDDVTERTNRHRTRLRWVRWVCNTGIAVLIVVTVFAFVMLIVDANRAQLPARGFDWLPVIESGINDLVFAAIGIFFLWALPSRLERRGELEQLHRLRSLAHVIDMHQLTKDPERLHPDFTPTAASAKPDLNAVELANYLDYCSEMLSLVAKTAALFGEGTSDTAVLSAVEGIEDLATGLSRKIWAKIALLPRWEIAAPSASD